MNIFSKVYSYATSYRNNMKKAVVCLVISGLSGVLPYYLIYTLLAKLIAGETVTSNFLVTRCGLLFLALLVKNGARELGLLYSHHLAYDTLMGMRQQMAAKLLKLPMGTLQKEGTGYYKKIFVENIEDMELILAHAIPEGLGNITSWLIIMIVMFVTNWQLALMGLLVIPVGLIAVVGMSVSGLKRIQPFYQAAQHMNNTIIEYISGMEVIKVFGQTTQSFGKFRDAVTKYKELTLDWYRVCWGFMSLYSVILPSALLFLLPMGGYLILQGQLTLSTFLFMTLLAMGSGPLLVRIVDFIPMTSNLAIKYKKIEEFFAQVELSDEGQQLLGNQHSLTFDNVSFAYDQEEVLKNISLQIRENEITALIGESGAGKSTMAKLLVRFWDVSEGQIYLGDTDLRQLSFSALMDAVSYVSQDHFLFNISIKENIRIGNPSATDAEIIEMARKAQCESFINELSDGYETVVGESGDRLSGGQRQRITIARAMLKDSPIVILDEATSSTDPENEDLIQAVLNELLVGKTVIIIAHRLSTIVGANQIVLLKDGEIFETGTHQELIKSSPTYQKMWRSTEENQGGTSLC